MRFVPTGALLGASLMLLATGCAGTARRDGMGPAGGNLTGRLMRPADPIARLNPAKVTVGSMYDQGSYTAANGPGAVQIAEGGSGPLSVGGGELAEQGQVGERRMNPGQGSSPRGQVREIASREGQGIGRSGSPGEGAPSSLPVGRDSRSSDEWPTPEVTEDGWPLIAVAGETRPATPGHLLTDEGSSTFRRIALQAPQDDSSNLDLSETIESPVESNRLCFDEPGPRGEVPRLLVDGIDLETYAAPPVSNDPNAQLASNRRPVAALRDARSALSHGTDLAQTEAETEPEPAMEGLSDEEIESAMPALPDLSEFLPTFQDGPQPELEPLDEPEVGTVDETEPDRDDVRPASTAPEPRNRRIDPHHSNASPSPFERSTILERIGGRVRKFQERLTPPRFRDGPRTALDSEATEGQPRTLRLPRLRSPEDARWLMPGGN